MGRGKGRTRHRREKSHGVAGDELQWLVVGDDDQIGPFARRLRDAVIRSLNLPPREQAYLAKDNSERSKLALRVESNPPIVATDSRARRVLRLCADDLWVSTEVVLRWQLRVWRLSSAAVRVFSGSAVDTSKTALFRAEWDFEEESAVHAQPHWQIYDPGDIPRGGLAGPDSGDDSVLPAELSESRRYKLGRFHFAMAARWHIADDHVVQLRSPDDLPAWVARCIGYIRGEMERSAGYH